MSDISPEPFRCICDPTDIFEPPDPTPRVVEGCPAHRARAAYQRFAESDNNADQCGNPSCPCMGGE